MKKKSVSDYSIGERIRYLRQKRSLSQTKTSELAGIAIPYLNQIEKGIRNPTVDTLIAIGKALEVNPAIFFLTDDVHVFDIKKLKSKYKNPDELNDTLYRALNEVIKYAVEIGFISGTPGGANFPTVKKPRRVA